MSVLHVSNFLPLAFVVYTNRIQSQSWLGTAPVRFFTVSSLDISDNKAGFWRNLGELDAIRQELTQRTDTTVCRRAALVCARISIDACRPGNYMFW